MLFQSRNKPKLGQAWPRHILLGSRMVEHIFFGQARSKHTEFGSSAIEKYPIGVKTVKIYQSRHHVPAITLISLKSDQALSQSSDRCEIHLEQVSLLFSICSIEISQTNSLFCFSAP